LVDILIGVLPLVFLGLLIAGCYDRQRSLLEALIVGALGWGLAAVTSLELLSLAGKISRLSVTVFWCLVSVGAATLILIRQRKKGVGEGAATHDQVGDPLYFVLAASTAAIAVVTITVALVAAPNNWDSLSYHLPRIEQWIQQGSLAHFPTSNIRQITSNPLAEMLILHFRLLAGSDQLDNLVQALAFVGCMTTSALVARRLGASRNGQILAALYVATLPMAILQGSSTQNDLLVSFFLLAAFERLLAWRSSGRVGNGVGVGAALGLAILAKGTAYFFAVPVFLFTLATIVRKPLRYNVRVGIFIVPIVLAINAGHYYRNVAQFGTPLGPQYGLASLDHSPGALFSSFLRNIASNLATPSVRLNDRLVHGVVSLHHLLGLNADDPNTTFPGEHFDLSMDITHEDGAPNPLHLCLAALTIVLLGVGMLRPFSNSRQSSAVWAYSVAVLLGGMLFCAMLRWQPWITRLQLPLFVLMGPAVATVLAARITRRWIIIGGVCLILAALPSALLNHRRPLLGEPPRNFGHRYTVSVAPNILSANVWQQMFHGNTQKYIAYRDAVASIANRASGGVGLALGGDNLEYQFWRMLNEDRSRVPVHIEHVCLLDNSSPGSTFQPEIVLATGRDQPAILICTNGVFEKEARFPSGDPAPNSDISIYHRLRTGPGD
jgi:4-amino-4-deoxy-L-arabinose transferase-like glycosyltransferase